MQKILLNVKHSVYIHDRAWRCITACGLCRMQCDLVTTNTGITNYQLLSSKHNFCSVCALFQRESHFCNEPNKATFCTLSVIARTFYFSCCPNFIRRHPHIKWIKRTWTSTYLKHAAVIMAQRCTCMWLTMQMKFDGSPTFWQLKAKRFLWKELLWFER